MNASHIFTHADRCRLGRLLSSDEAKGVVPWHVLDKLECLLEESAAMQPESIPDDVVTMNSTVRLVDVDSSDELTCTVVYPDDVDLIDNGISVLESLGARLIGCEVDDLVECETQQFTHRWRIVEIVFQPERVDKFEL